MGNKFDKEAAKQYPITQADFTATFKKLYPKRPNFNQYTECSSRGTCDYATGECKCFDGFEGRGCRRTTCPNGCSGHGRCLSNMDINPNQYMSFTDMFGGTFTTRPILDHAPSCAIPSGQKLQPCPEVQYALMDLPNFAIPEVEVDAIELTAAGSGAAKTATSLYTVQFTDPSNAGKQNTLTCELVADSSVDGAQPRYTSVTSCEVYNVGGPEWFDESGEKQTLNLKAKFTELANKQKADILGAANTANAGTTYEDFQPCSSKGDCDAATGTCTCNAGHYGEACEKQST